MAEIDVYMVSVKENGQVPAMRFASPQTGGVYTVIAQVGPYTLAARKIGRDAIYRIRVQADEESINRLVGQTFTPWEHRYSDHVSRVVEGEETLSDTLAKVFGDLLSLATPDLVWEDGIPSPDDVDEDEYDEESDEEDEEEDEDY